MIIKKFVRNKNIGYILIGGAVIDILYQSSMLLLFILGLQKVVSYVRYTNTGMLAVYGFLFCVLVYLCLEKEKFVYPLAVYGILLCLLAFGFKEKKLDIFTDFRWPMASVTMTVEDCILKAEGASCIIQV